MEINTAYDAYWFIHGHPNAMEVDPEHPLVDLGEYKWEGIQPNGWGAHDGKEYDDEYHRAVKEKAVRNWWNGQFIINMNWDYHMVNPETRSIDDDRSKNTHMEVWLETGPAYFDGQFSNKYQGNMHDPRLDCGGATMEDALIKMAARIKEFYGDYEG